MSEKFWIQDFETGLDRLRIHFVTERGRVSSIHSRTNTMNNNNYIGLTEKNLDLLAEFLTNELENPALTAQIPNESHIFHGTYNDSALTQANVELATQVLLGMALGYVEDAPLVMVFESKPDQRIVIDLSGELQKARTFIEVFQQQSQQNIADRINMAVAA